MVCFRIACREGRQRNTRRSSNPSHPAIVERLEDRLVLDAGTQGAAAFAFTAPSRFTSMTELDQSLIDAAVAEWGWALGKNFPPGTLQPVFVPAAVGALRSTYNAVPASNGPSVVETDGRYLYVLANGELDIIDARNPRKMSVVSRTAVNGTATAEYLDGTHLTIITGITPITVTDSSGGFVAGNEPIAHSEIAWAELSQTVVTEFDVSNPNAPQTVRTSTLDGAYVDSQEIGDQVYVVLRTQFAALPAPTYTSTADGFTFETEAEYRAQLTTAITTMQFPQYHSTLSGRSTEASGPLLSADAIYKPELPTDRTLYAIAVFDVRSQTAGPTNVVGVFAGALGPAVYANQGHMYFASLELTNPANVGTIPSGTLDPWMVIRKFSLDGDTVTMTAVGAVRGAYLQQGSLDEQGDFFRIATNTTNDDSGHNTYMTNVYVMSEQNGILNIVGEADNLAPGESIYAVRFLGDRAYIVTYNLTDPLLAIDLSDAANPKVAGTLTIPGYSRSLIPIDATHLVGIGRSVDPKTGVSAGLQLSLFDVSDLAHPKLVSTTALGPSDWLSAEAPAEFDPNGVTYSLDTHVLAIVVDGYTSSTVAGTPTSTFHSEVETFKVDPSTGFTSLGTVSHDTAIERVLTVGDVLFSISEDEVKANDLLDPTTELGHVNLFSLTPGGGTTGSGSEGGASGSDTSRPSANAGSTATPNPAKGSAPTSTAPSVASLIDLFRPVRRVHPRFPARKVNHTKRPTSSHSPSVAQGTPGAQHVVRPAHGSLRRLANRRLA